MHIQRISRHEWVNFDNVNVISKPLEQYTEKLDTTIIHFIISGFTLHVNNAGNEENRVTRI